MSAEPRSHGRSPWRDAYEMLVSRPRSDAESSVSLTRNAKGAVQFEVVVRDPDAVLAKLTAQAIFDTLAAIYPYPVESAVSPPAEPLAVGSVTVGLPTGGRSRARVKP